MQWTKPPSVRHTEVSEVEHASNAVHEDGVKRGVITKHLGGTIAIFVLAHDLTSLSSMPAMAILIEASAA
jgi:hypothetical protein